jgi:hypothetical protein
MSFAAPTPEDLLPEIVTQVNISIGWAERAKDADRLGEATEDICAQYRAMAICGFALEGDVDEFFHWLIHSPLTRRYYLTTVRDRPLPPSIYTRASFADPMLDAIAAKQWKLANDLGELSSAKWQQRFEYEDDFCYFDFLRKAVAPKAEGVTAVLRTWRDALEGAADDRLDVVEAIHGRQRGAFEDNVQKLLAVHEAKARVMVHPATRSSLASELSFFPNRWISIEGLALLAIGEQVGLIVPGELDACPRALRVASYAPFTSKGYPNQPI